MSLRKDWVEEYNVEILLAVFYFFLVIGTFFVHDAVLFVMFLLMACVTLYDMSVAYKKRVKRRD